VHGLLSLHTIAVPAHRPPEQVSVAVHAFPSSQDAVLFVWTQPVAGSQLSSVHGLLSSQFNAPVPGWQLPPAQTSPVVQKLPSSHAAVLFVKTQPVAGLQLSVVQALLSLQTTAEPGTHTPPPHVSPKVQAFPSLHGFVLFVKTQPEAGLQLSSVHGLLSLHTTGVPGLQTPPPQVSPAVQALPSLHGFVLFVKTQPEAGSHVSVVHTLLSLQTIGVPTHEPPLHVSLEVQALPSSHEFVLFVNTQPKAGLHVSVVQTLLSLQTTGVPPHTPPAQLSPNVHALLSVHVVPSPAFGFVHTPVPVLHVPATWHASSAVHTTGFEPVQTPDWQVSVCVHALASLHAVPLVF
jgi:hypothetical protein